MTNNVTWMTVPCPSCLGTGYRIKYPEIIKTEDKCPVCFGEGYYEIIVSDGNVS